MKEHGILFSAPMVRALLAGTKTQTRRVVKPQPEKRHPFLAFRKRRGPDFWLWPNAREEVIAECPYGKPGDRLWVRETHCAFDVGRVHYRADHALDPAADKAHGIRWTPAIHMPRWASRITLEITGARVERLQDISEADATAEGSRDWAGEQDTPARDIPGGETRLIYRQLWESINGAGSWDANPWVWVIEFRRAGR